MGTFTLGRKCKCRKDGRSSNSSPALRETNPVTFLILFYDVNKALRKGVVNFVCFRVTAVFSRVSLSVPHTHTTLVGYRETVFTHSSIGLGLNMANAPVSPVLQ